MGLGTGISSLAYWLRRGAGEEAPPVEPLFKTIVVLGASIMEGSFGRNLTVPHTDASSLWYGVDVYGYAFSGDQAQQTVEKFQTALDTFPGSDVLFVLHTGGNNVSSARPYATADPALLQTLSDAYDTLFDMADTRPGQVVFANISFREYANPATSSAMLLDGSTGSEPFNEHILLPKLRARFPDHINVDGMPVLDFFNWSRNNCKGFLTTDGVHASPTGRADLRRFFRERLGYLVYGGEMPPPIPRLDPWDIDPTLDPEGPEEPLPDPDPDPDPEPEDPALEVIVSLGGDDATTPNVNHILAADVNNESTVSLVALDGTDHGITVFCRAPGAPANANGAGRNGFGIPAPKAIYDGVDILATEFTSASIYVNSPYAAFYTITGLAPSAPYEFQLVGARVAETERITRISDGTGVFAEWNTSEDPPQLTTVTFISDENGTIELTETNPQGTTYAYFGAFKLKGPLPS